MVCEYLDGVESTFQLGSPFFKGTNDRHEFLIIDLVICLSRIVLLGVKGNRVEKSFVIVLRQDASGDIIRSISYQNNLAVPIKVSQDGGSGKCILQILECFLVFGGPFLD